MDCPQRTAAEDVLRYNEQTWGRSWVFAERFFHQDTSLFAWNDLSVSEQEALQALDWTSSNWQDAAYVWPAARGGVGEGTLSQKDWAALSEDYKTALTSIGFSQWLWDNVQLQTVQVTGGCFYDAARGEVVKSIWKSTTDMMPPVKAKGLTCPSDTTAWTLGPSKMYDDKQCTPAGYCDPGTKQTGSGPA